MNVAVVGAAGVLGRRFCEFFTTNEIEFLAVGRSQLDITDNEAVALFFAENPTITHTVLCAAYTNVDKAETNKLACFTVNVEGVKNVVRCFGGTLIHFSTDFVFDGANVDGYWPNDIRRPVNVYGASKKAAEDFLMDLKNKKWANIRISSLVDENAKFSQFLNRTVLNQNSVQIWNTNRMIPTIATELVEQVYTQFLLNDFESGHYHLPSMNLSPMSWYDLAVLMYPNHKHLFAPVPKFKTVAKRPRFSVLR